MALGIATKELTRHFRWCGNPAPELLDVGYFLSQRTSWSIASQIVVIDNL